MAWRPLSRRADGGDGEFDALHEGVPVWLRSSLLDWVHRQLSDPVFGTQAFSSDRLRLLERRLHITGLDWTSAEQALRSLVTRCEEDPDFFLDVVDASLATVSFPAGRADLDRVKAMLDEAGSAWTLGLSGPSGGGGVFELRRRVDATVVTAARSTIAGSGRAGQFLAAAWSAAYGRHPNPGHAYGEAVRAVEAAAIPVVCPADSVATLGKILGTLRTQRRFTVALHPPRGDPTDALIGMLELLWTAQLDRHGTADESVPSLVTEIEARTAVQLATTLVQWFSAGSIIPVPAPPRP